MRRLFLIAALLAIHTACSGSGAARGPCDDLCDELVGACGYAAYPDLGSCLDGCAYYEQNGADVPGQSRCITDAACDTFLILECEHAYGLDQ